MIKSVCMVAFWRPKSLANYNGSYDNRIVLTLRVSLKTYDGDQNLYIIAATSQVPKLLK